MNLQLIQLIVTLVLEFLKNITFKINQDSPLGFIIEVVKDDPTKAVDKILQRNFSSAELSKIANELKSKI